jgi:hypothetical protein
MKAVPLTENSWILYKKTERCGLMRSVDEGYSIVGGPYKGDYDDLEALQKRIKDTITFEDIKAEEEQEQHHIDDFPIRHTVIYDVTSASKKVPYPTYTKRKGSEDTYAAGHYAVCIGGNWVHKYCPRVRTLQEGLYHGPFKTKIEANHSIKVENSK